MESVCPGICGRLIVMAKSVDLETSRTSVMRMVVLLGAIGDVGGTGGAVLAMSVSAGVVGL